MKALILAAGEGTRLRPLTLDKPKPMLPVGGVPLLERTVWWLAGHGVRQIAINLHYKPQTIVDHFGDGSRLGVAIRYAREETILGTAGAAKNLEGYLDETFCVVYGDVLTDMDLGALARFHRQRGGALTLSLYHVENPSACGLVGMDEVGRIARFVEKPPPEEVFTDLANAGVMIAEPSILAHIPPATFYDFGHDLLPRLLERGVPMYGWPIAEGTLLIDIGTHEKYARAQEAVRGAPGGRTP